MGGKGSSEPGRASGYFDPAIFGENYVSPAGQAQIRVNPDATPAEKRISSELGVGRGGSMPYYMDPTILTPWQPPPAERTNESLLPVRAPRDEAENPRKVVKNPKDRNDYAALYKYYSSLLLEEGGIGADGEGNSGLGSLGDIGVGGTSGLA